MSDKQKGGQPQVTAEKVVLWGVVVAVLGACAYLVYSQQRGQAEIERQVAEREQKRQERRAAQRKLEESESPSRHGAASEKSRASTAATRNSRANSSS